MKQISKRYLSILMTLIMVFGLFSGISLQINAEESKPTQSDISTVEATAQADDITTVLAFTSDTHNGGRQGLDNISAERLATWVENAEAKHGEIDVMGFGGDMGSANSSSPTVFWQNSQNVMNSVTQGVGKGVYTTGNHEYQMGGNYATAIEDPNSTYYDTVSNYIENSIGDNGSDYVMYCMGSSSYAEPNGGWNRYTDSQISALRTFLNEDHGDKVIFVITHYPLHKTSARTVNGADNVLTLLNTAATEKGLKIVYLWGHNHTDAPNAETNYDKIFKPDDKITDDVGERTIHFYYAAAGCMSDDEYGTGSHSVLGKGLLVTINTKKQLSFTYYDAVGNNVTKGGSYIERDPVPITGVQIVGDDNQPFTDTPSVQEKKSLKLKYKVEPADGTVKTVKWESDDPGIASVDKTTGKVKGVSKGSTKITLTISDGISSEPKTDSIDINVTERESTDLVTYELTNTLEDDGEYLIVNANDGSGYALKNPGEISGSVNVANVDYKTEVDIMDDCIETDETDIIWTATALANGSGFELTNEDVYLEGSGGNVVFADPQINKGRYWTYSSSNGLQHRNPNSSGYGNTPYTLGYNESNKYFEGTNSYYGSNNKNVYLFKKTTPAVDPTGITVSPTTLNLSVGETATITAKVEPSNADKKVTWTSERSDIAKVSNGTVTAVGEGETTITAATKNGFEASCKVKVTAGETATYVLTNKMEAGKKYLIATGKEGSVYLLADAQSNNKIKSVQATAADGKITIPTTTAKAALFEAEGANDNSILLKAGSGGYLYASSSDDLGLVAKSSINNEKFWHYKDKDNNGADINLLWFYRGTDGDYGYSGTSYNKYYLTWDANGNFAKGTLDTRETFVSTTKTVPKIYLFTEDDGSGETPETYTVTFHANGHGTAPAAINDVESGSLINEPQAPSAEGWTFGGWYKEAASENAWNFATDKVTKNTDLYAKWTENTVPTYTVTFHANGHGTAPAAINNVASGSLINEPQAPSAEGWTFGGWYKEASCENAWNFATDKVTKNTDLYAKWTENTVTTYTVTFHANGHGTAPAAINNVASGSLINEPQAPSAEGWTFGGWYKEAGCENAWNFATDKVTKNTDLYVKWTEKPVPTYTVTYHANGHGTAPAAINNVASGSLINEPQAPSAEGWTFGGWYKEAGCENAWNFASDKVTKNTDLYAKWTENTVTTYTVTFHANGHGTAPAAINNVASGSLINEPQAPSEEGWTFGGWYKEAACENAWNFATDKVTKNTDLYAKWTQAGGEETIVYDVTLPLGFTGPETVEKGKDYKFTKSADADDYIYSDVSYRVDSGDPVNITPDADGVYTIENVTGNLLIIGSRRPKEETHEHTYGTPSYNWAKDYSKCTATATCTGCPEGTQGHIVTETVDTKYSVVKAASSTAVGTGRYTATFINKLFTTQTQDVEIPKTTPTPAPTPTPTPTPKTNPPAPAADPSKNPAKMGKDGTPFGEGASLAAAEKAILSLPNDNDPAGTQFSKLTLRSPKQTKSSIKLSWTKPGNAKTFIVYGNNCGKTNKPKKLATVSGTSLNIKAIAGKKLAKGMYCKFIVLALDGSNMVVTTSKIIHVATKGGKVGNDKSISVKKSVIKKAKKMKAGKSLKVNAKAVPQSKNLKVKKHVAVRYESTDTTIATVTKKGKITAKKKGKCNVYAYAQNGVFKKIKVVVR